ncbi:MAG: heparinase II/III family protein [Gemmatimonadaceae bacterium]|nr:heparinase II/III family protein [Gemmatimonadaceae bacterium]
MSRIPERFPRCVVPAAGAPDDVDALLVEAERLLSGDWPLFGQRVRPFDRDTAWRRHPSSGTLLPLPHFSRASLASEDLGGDVKEFWELNRHAGVVRLAQGFHLTGDPRMGTLAVSHLLDWSEQNPPGRGANWTSALEVAFRAIAWCWVWGLTAKSDAWTPAAVARISWELHYAARFLMRYDSVHHSPNTHLTGEALGALYIGTLLPELRIADEARTFGISVLQAEAPHQFLADGLHFERATGYHRYHVEFYVHATAIARTMGASWDATWQQPLRDGLDAMHALRRPDGSWPVFGDEDGGATLALWAGRVPQATPILELGEALHTREPSPLPSPAGTLTWWFGQRPPQRPEQTRFGAIALDAAGYMGAAEQNGWYVIVDAGPHGGDVTGHAHTDLGHIEIARGDSRIVVDPGCGVYGHDVRRRDWYRSLGAHATVTINGNPLAQPSGAFGWAAVAPTPERVHRLDDCGWQGRLWYGIPGTSGRHERQVVLVPQCGVVVVDWISGLDQTAGAWHWPLATSAVTLARDARWVRVGEVVLSWAASDAIRASQELTPRSPRYGEEAQAVSLYLSATAHGRLGLVTTFTAAEAEMPLLVVGTDAVQATLSCVGGQRLDMVFRPERDVHCTGRQ